MRITGILWLIFLSISVYSQTDNVPLRFKKITIEQGLPHNFVHSIAQDKKGFIWVATNYGLARYDGYHFKVFQPNLLKPYSITHKQIGHVYTDKRGFLWLSVNSGINKMDLSTERFKGYFFDATQKHPIGNYFRKILEDKDSVIWISTNMGLFYYNQQQDQFIYTLDKKNFVTRENDIMSFTDDGTGNIWFALENKVGILHKKTGTIKTLSEYLSNNQFDTLDIHSVYSFENGKVWLSTYRNGLFSYDINTRKLDRFLQNVPFLSHVYIDKKGNLYAVQNNLKYKLFVCRKENLSQKRFEEFPFFQSANFYQTIQFIEDGFGTIWFSSAAGFGNFNFKNGVTIYKANELEPNAISDDNIESIFIDRTDNIWVCPLRKGINKADLRQKPFQFHSRPIISISDILRDKNVSAVFVDSKDHLWFSDASSGVSVYNKKNGNYYRYYLNTNNPITTIYEDNLGYMWLGASWDLLFRIKPENLSEKPANKELKFSNIEGYPEVKGVRKIVSDKYNNLWFVTLTGLYELNREQNKFINHSVSDSLNAISSFYRTVFIDQHDIIWTGSNSGGLCKYEPSKKVFKHFLHNPQNVQSISSNTVYAIYQDKEGILWIGTGLGLERFNPKTEVFGRAGESNELRNRTIFSIIPDTSGNLWMSCDIGIIRYNIATNKSYFYGAGDGLQNNEFNTTASFADKTGRIYFGGMEGLVSFYPSDIKPNPIFAKPVITNIRIRNQVISPGDSLNRRILMEKQVWETNKIELHYREAEFTLEFSALHYSAPENIKYQYKLEGFNSDWIYTDSKMRYASYTGLPPGEYVFKVLATNNDGLMCKPEDEVRLTIVIIPPFWQTIWFKFILFIIVAIIALLLYRYRVRSLRKSNILLNNKVKDRTRELEDANMELRKRSLELEEVNTTLEERQEEINIQKEQIQAQYQYVEESNKLLKEHQQQIIEQNIELDQHRNKLEFLVEQRTRELEMALIKAEESDKLKTSFLTNMSHEIRTPMNAIIGFSSLLKDPELQHKHDEFVRIITSNGNMLLTLINDILELSSLQTQQISLNFLNVNLYGVLNKIFITHKIEIENKGLKLKLDISLINEMYSMILDEIRLKQVLSNLISNSLKFTEKGFIEFGIFSLSDKITFYVKDTGIGIDKSIGNAIFERFYKIEKDKNQLYRGTGLGLAICKNIVELWNGEIWYESEPGKGTTFFFTHPRFIENLPNNDQQDDSEMHLLDLSNKKILITEDEESNYQLLVYYLKNTNVEIFWAKNGEEAIELFKEHNFDFILMDIKMPVMDGIEASRKIRTVNPNLPIIAQTAYAFKSEIDEILACGIHDYLIKPIQKHQLFEVLAKYL